MKAIPCYQFFKTKYGGELLVDVVPLEYAKKFLKQSATHTLAYYDITLITKGHGRFIIDRQETEVFPGDIIFSQPGEVRGWDTERITGGYALIFEEEFLLNFFNDPCFIQNLSYFKPDKSTFRLTLTKELDEKISGLIHEVKAEIDFNIQKDQHILRALLYEALMLLNRAYIHSCLPEQNKESLPHRYMTRFIAQVNTSYKTNHDVTFYAGKLCITPGYLNEIVRSATGENAKQYIRRKLLQEAKRLIVYTELSIGEIAEQLGYENTSYFIRMFRKETEQTPLEYRKCYLRGNSLF